MEFHSSILAKDKGLFSETNTQPGPTVTTPTQQELLPEKIIIEP